MPRGTRIATIVVFVLLLGGLAGLDWAVTKDALVLPRIDQIVQNGESVEPDVAAVSQALGLTAVETRETALLSAVLPEQGVLTRRVLLQEDDRVAFVAWADSPYVQEILHAMRKALSTSFSSDLEDLIDETQSETGVPPRDVLAFRDAAIHPERIVFIRIRGRLYEFHVALGKEATVDRLIDRLTE